jgi:hypothetical protein
MAYFVQNGEIIMLHLMTKKVFCLLAIALALPTIAAGSPAPVQMPSLASNFTVFYDGVNYTGFAAHVYDDQYYGSLGTLANKASSLVSYSTAEWTYVWTGANRSGYIFCFAPLAQAPDLRAYPYPQSGGTWNNNIESIQLSRLAPRDFLKQLVPPRTQCDQTAY